MNRILLLFLVFANLLIPVCLPKASAQTEPNSIIFDDRNLIEGYMNKYHEEPKDVLLAMIRDNALTPYRRAAAVRVFKEKFSQNIFGREKRIVEKALLRRLNRSDSPFVQVEIMHTLCLMDRYKFFNSMVPDLIHKLDHYNRTVNEFAHESLRDIIERGTSRAREARVVFNVIRKNLYLNRDHLQGLKEAGPRLKLKFNILRWSIKILGTEELKHLPPEMISLL